MNLNLNNVSLKMSAGMPSQFPKDPIPQIVFSGRSNVGKSSLINSLLGRKSLARVSASPGKTITINFYEIDRKLYFVDLPGYGFAKRTEADKRKWSALTNGFFTANKNFDLVKLVVQLIDSRIGPTTDDRDMLNFLSQGNIPHIVVATKSDKLNAGERKKFLDAASGDDALADAGAVILCSSSNGEGKDAVWDQILQAAGIAR